MSVTGINSSNISDAYTTNTTVKDKTPVTAKPETDKNNSATTDKTETTKQNLKREILNNLAGKNSLQSTVL